MFKLKSDQLFSDQLFKEFFFRGEKFYLQELTPFENRYKNESNRVASPGNCFLLAEDLYSELICIP